MSSQPLSEKDRAELAKFELYLDALIRCNQENTPLIMPSDEMAIMELAKKQIHGHASVYKQIYGENP